MNIVPSSHYLSNFPETAPLATLNFSAFIAEKAILCAHRFLSADDPHDPPLLNHPKYTAASLVLQHIRDLRDAIGLYNSVVDHPDDDQPDDDLDIF